MGRGLSPQQIDTLEWIESGSGLWGSGSERVAGCNLRLDKPFEPDFKGREKRFRKALQEHNILAASRSRTLRRLRQRGLIKVVRVDHYFAGSGNYSVVRLAQLTEAGKEVMVKFRRREVNHYIVELHEEKKV
jgi:hypothetical protein